MDSIPTGSFDNYSHRSRLLLSPMSVLRWASYISSLFFFFFFFLLNWLLSKIKLMWKRSILCIDGGWEAHVERLMERLRECYCFPPFVSSPVPGNRVDKEAIFLFYVHTYSIHIYLYHILLNQKVGFQWNTCFLIINLFLNVIWIIMYSYYRAFEGWGGRSFSEGFVLLFLQGFIFDCFVLLAICAKP